MAERFRIGLPETVYPFMPPADKFLEYMGTPGGIAGVINKLGASLQQPLPDPKTVRKAVREGVSPRIGSKIEDILESVSKPEMHDYITSPYLSPWMETKLHHNGLAWLCMIRGQHLQIFQADQPETLTEQFIKRRAEQEMEILQAGLAVQKSSASTAISKERWRVILNNFLPRHTGVESIHIERGLQAGAALQSSTGQLRNEQAGLLLGLYTRLRIDFYYNVTAGVILTH